MKYFRTLIITLLSISFLQACNDINTEQITLVPESNTIIDSVKSNVKLTTLAAALQQEVLDGVLAEEIREFTVFATSQVAFEKLPEGTLDSLTIEQFTDILLYYITPEKVIAEGANTFEVELTKVWE